MKSNIRILVLLAVMLPLLLMQSCSEKQQPDPFEDNLFLVSSKVEFMRTKENMVTLLNYGAILYPEIAGLIPEVKTGVNIYSITYNTTFMGEDVLASGLIMVPSVPGAYPVLSYQNGTNTLNANAPSVDPDYQAYQFLQCVASTGYVVASAS